MSVVAFYFSVGLLLAQYETRLLARSFEIRVYARILRFLLGSHWRKGHTIFWRSGWLPLQALCYLPHYDAHISLFDYWPITSYVLDWSGHKVQEYKVIAKQFRAILRKISLHNTKLQDFEAVLNNIGFFDVGHFRILFELVSHQQRKLWRFILIAADHGNHELLRFSNAGCEHLLASTDLWQSIR